MSSEIGPGQTQPHAPVDPIAETQPVISVEKRSRARTRFAIFVSLALILLTLVLYPGRTNILFIGLDRSPEGTKLSRSDSLILATYQPHLPYLGLLSIPRDLWVEIPGVGFNRINAAHFFAEAEQMDSGPAASLATVSQNFGVEINAYIRLEFSGLVRFVDALGGVPISIDTPVGELPAGDHNLTGEQALAYVRDRSGTDDFFRMEHGRLFIQAVVRRMWQPSAWPRIPIALLQLSRSIDSDLGFVEWIRLAYTLFRVGPQRIDGRQITREMTTGFVTQGGAQVLQPNWVLIRPMVEELFGKP